MSRTEVSSGAPRQYSLQRSGGPRGLAWAGQATGDRQVQALICVIVMRYTWRTCERHRWIEVPDQIRWNASLCFDLGRAGGKSGCELSDVSQDAFRGWNVAAALAKSVA